MKIYLRSINKVLWNIVEVAFEKPHTNYDKWIDDQKKSVNPAAKAINALSCALNKKNSSCVNNYISTSNLANITGIKQRHKI